MKTEHAWTRPAAAPMPVPATAAPGARSRAWPVIPLLLLLFTLASAWVINPYRYGGEDNSITIPMLKATVDSQLYPGDYALGQRRFYYTYLWAALGQIHRRLDIGLPALFFGVYLAALWLTFAAVYLISKSLFHSRRAGILALVFLLASRITLGGVDTIEPMLNTRSVATPLLLLALYCFLNRKVLLAFALAGVAYLIHPLTTHYVLAMLALAGVVQWRRFGRWRLASGLALFLTIASPLLIWKFRNTPASFHLFTVDPRWLQVLHVRSAHHVFPLDWGWPAMVRALVTLAVFGVVWRYRNRAEEVRHRVILSGVVAILALGLVGVVFSAFHPLGIVLLLQPVRSFQFMEYIVMIYAAYAVCEAFARTDDWRGRIVPLAAGTAVFLMGRHPTAAFLVFLGSTAALARWRPRGGPDLVEGRFYLAITCLLCLATGGARLSSLLLHSPGRLYIHSIQAPLWRDLQRWARQNTDVRDAFIVPPLEDEFRVESERSVYADWEDGGLGNEDPAFALEWVRRMRRLRFDTRTWKDDYCSLSAEEIRSIAREMESGGPRRIFLVWPRWRSKQTPPAFPERYRNHDYAIYEVTGVAMAARLPRSRQAR